MTRGSSFFNDCFTSLLFSRTTIFVSLFKVGFVGLIGVAAMEEQLRGPGLEEEDREEEVEVEVDESSVRYCV